MDELENLVKGDGGLEDMVFTIKELSEEEKIAEQCFAREDYQRRLIGAERGGYKQGIEQGIKALIADYIEDGKTEEQIIERLKKRFALSENEAKERYIRYTKN